MSAATRLRNGTKRNQLTTVDNTPSVPSKSKAKTKALPHGKDSKATEPAGTQTKKPALKHSSTLRSAAKAEASTANAGNVGQPGRGKRSGGSSSALSARRAATHVTSADAIKHEASPAVSDTNISNGDSNISAKSLAPRPAIKRAPAKGSKPAAAAAASTAKGSGTVPSNRITKRKAPVKRSGTKSNGSAKQQQQQEQEQRASAAEKSSRKIATPKIPGTANHTHTLTRELSKTSITSSEEETANFIMSSPKREPRKALRKIGALQGRNNTIPDGSSKRRRAEDSTDDDLPRSPGFNSPSHKRMRTASAAAVAAAKERIKSSASSSSAVRLVDCGKGAQTEPTGSETTPPNKKHSSNTNGGAQSSPFKSILSPVFDLLRRVSGIAHDPLGLQKQDSYSSAESDASTRDKGNGGVEESPSLRKKSKENMQPLVAESETSSEVDCAGAPVDSPEANSLTAPPMNPTTMGTAAAGLTSYLGGEFPESGGMQLYLPDSNEYIGPDSYTGSPATPGYPETPSKENIPVYTEHDVLVGLETQESGITALAPAAGLAEMSAMGSAYQSQHYIRNQGNLVLVNELRSGDSDLSLSHVSTPGDSEFDAQSDSYFAYDDEEDEFNPYLFMADLPPIPKEHTLRPYALPRKTRSSPPITLVLDLDETLVHCALNKVESPDLVFPVEYNGVNYNVYCRLRPGYREFLEKASQLFEVVIFTASQQVYADRLLNLIDPDRRYIRHRLFRDSCVYVNTNYVKDLGILGRDVAKMVLVDNCPQAFAYQQSNGIPIESWYEDKNDRELTHLMEFLLTLVDEDDVRPKVDAFFKTKEKVVDAKKRYQLKGRRLPAFL
ncbi:hypothetical protein LPJ59_002765 [Coemansia sp. RSA 2399]|nr:hypothetical protein LPJ59_002765 [Coemansia sp. RSA 2399]